MAGAPNFAQPVNTDSSSAHRSRDQGDRLDRVTAYRQTFLQA